MRRARSATDTRIRGNATVMRACPTMTAAMIAACALLQSRMCGATNAAVTAIKTGARSAAMTCFWADTLRATKLESP
jgi:hypothetical protein